MEKSELLKLTVIVMAAMFVISMFINFGSGRVDEDEDIIAQNTAIGVAATTCKIAAFASELTIEPWKVEYSNITNRLKEENQIDYVNLIGAKGIVLLPASGDITAVRSEFINYDVDVVSVASCNINRVVNFTMSNGTVNRHAVSSVRVLLDPHTQVGDEIDVDLISEIEEFGVSSTRAVPATRSESANLSVLATCTDNHLVEGAVHWDKRDINTTEFTEIIGVPFDALEYTKNDVVTFEKAITLEEVDMIKSKNISSIIDINENWLITLSTDKVLIESAMEGIDTTLNFRPSLVEVSVGKNLTGNVTVNDVADALEKEGIIITRKHRACTLTLNDTITVLDKEMFVPHNTRQLDYFLDAENLTSNSEIVDVYGDVRYIGRIITDFELRGMR